jgi:hypothetical protein
MLKNQKLQKKSRVKSPLTDPFSSEKEIRGQKINKMLTYPVDKCNIGPCSVDIYYSWFNESTDVFEEK